MPGPEAGENQPTPTQLKRHAFTVYGVVLAESQDAALEMVEDAAHEMLVTPGTWEEPEAPDFYVKPVLAVVGLVHAPIAIN